MAKFFAHLLYTDALPWTCLETIRLSEDATTSSSRIFIKILVLVRALGVASCMRFCLFVCRRLPASCWALLLVWVCCIWFLYTVPRAGVSVSAG